MTPLSLAILDALFRNGPSNAVQMAHGIRWGSRRIGARLQVLRKCRYVVRCPEWPGTFAITAKGFLRLEAS